VLTWFPELGMRVRLPHLPHDEFTGISEFGLKSEIRINASVVKWTSFLASNEKVRVRLLAEACSDGSFGLKFEIKGGGHPIGDGARLESG
jgi:hypothetical protein